MNMDAFGRKVEMSTTETEAGEGQRGGQGEDCVRVGPIAPILLARMQGVCQPLAEFVVLGKPAPGGSKKGFAFRRKNGKLGVALADAGKNNAEWKALVSHEAAQVWKEPPTGKPLFVRMTFYQMRPKKHFGTRKGQMFLRADAPKFPISKPDALKLARSTEDAMTGIVWMDDSANVDVWSRKRWGDRPGVLVEIFSMEACDESEEWASEGRREGSCGPVAGAGVSLEARPDQAMLF